ncbi:flavin reductase [Micromonospora rosaria]|uniref:Flavin reductase n=1 Tax=Micromonospora rosaria TaxID=47874 RepID=A0A136PNP4_9ACTN|nr:flavin reductase [Micromonospora rosaria]
MVPVDQESFREMLRRRAATVAVVTAVARPAGPPGRGGGGLVRAGVTATSFTAVSVDPPLVSFCLDAASAHAPVLARAEHVAVHLLATGQEDAARTFADGGVGRSVGYPEWVPGPFGLPLLSGVLARLLCRVVHRLPIEGRTLVIAEPLALGGGRTPA